MAEAETCLDQMKAMYILNQTDGMEKQSRIQTCKTRLIDKKRNMQASNL